MPLKSILSGISLFALLACPVLAAEPLAPRGEVSVKGGTDRSLLTTEFWAPLAQQSDRVLYGDIRLMGDNDDNREGNLGVGYRQIQNDAVVGVHGWIDRRRTQHNSTFHQLTFGVERLGHIVDARANVYIPLNQSRTIITPNMGVTTPYLAGSGIYYDTNGSINETPQYGIDGELGYRIPVFKKQIDAIRVYGGGYYFFRDNTLEVPGVRFRTEAQVNKIFSVGARMQYDKPRGTQGFLEATLKFPFSAKRLYQESGIRSRLDESPERDVDIVTNAKVDTGLFKPVIDAVTGTPQRILYVDNTKADGGDGSYEKPFNNLKSAEAALQANDILYVNRGDGTTRNMNQGIVIDKTNVQLIGSGVALTYGGHTLLNAGTAPIITNTQTKTSDYTGNGVLVTADNALVSGVQTSGAMGHGIIALANNANWNRVTLSHNISTGNVWYGMIVVVNNGGRIQNITMDNDRADGNQIRAGLSVNIEPGSSAGTVSVTNSTANGNLTTNGLGIRVQSFGTGSSIDNLVMRNNTATNNANGIVANAGGGGKISNVTMENLTATSNRVTGVLIQAVDANSILGKVTVDNVQANNNTLHGFNLFTNLSGMIDNAQISNVTTHHNTIYGTYILSQNNSRINTAVLSNITSYNNTDNGMRTEIMSSAILASITLSGITTTNNVRHGTSILANGGTINSITASNIITSGNTLHGFMATAINSGRIDSANVFNVTANSNSGNGIHIEALSSGSMNNVTLSNSTGSTNQYGLQVVAAATSLMNGIKIDNNRFTGNSANGVFINKAGAATFIVDFGGGSLNSAGRNTVTGNTGTEVRIDNGYAMSARGNYWGGGDLSVGEKTLNGGSTIDTTGFLTTAP